jgi:chromosome segregation ATPase
MEFCRHPELKPIHAKLNRILEILEKLERREKTMSTQLDALTAQVTANESLENSAITLIQGIAAQLAAIKDDPAKIQALADSLKTSADSLSAAIIANTPAAPVS